MPGQDKRTRIKHQHLYGAEGRASVDFEGGRVIVINSGEDSQGRVRLDLATSKGARPHITLYGEWRDYGEGLEFVETAPRGYW